MVTLNQKQVAVLALVDKSGLPQHRACVVVDQHRSTQRHCLVCSAEEMGSRQRITALAVNYLHYGCRRIHVMLLCDGCQVNRKRVQRLWRLESLHVQRPKCCKPKIARVPIVVRSQYPNHVWAIDFQFDQTADGQPVQVLNVPDKFTREALTTSAARRITAAGTMAVLDQIRELHGAPQFLRVDNGAEFLAETLREQCRDKIFNPTIATRVHHDKTVVSNHSTLESETNYCPEKCLIRCGKSVSCSKNIATTADHTVHFHI